VSIFTGVLGGRLMVNRFVAGLPEALSITFVNRFRGGCWFFVAASPALKVEGGSIKIQLPNNYQSHITVQARNFNAFVTNAVAVTPENGPR